MSNPAPASTLRRDRYLSQLKPFHQLDIVQRTSISLWKKQFEEYSNELRNCLNALDVAQLEPYLAWVPSNKLQDFTQLAEGGFAKVYSARITVSQEYQFVAAKELKDSMVTEVRSYNYI